MPLENLKEKFQFEDHAGRMVYTVDYSCLNDEDKFLEVIRFGNKYRKELLNPGMEGRILMLVDMTDSTIYGSVRKELERTGKEIESYIKKRAIVGLNPMQKVSAAAFNLLTKKKLKALDTREEAIDWLLKGE